MTPITPTPQTLYPAKDSLDEALAYIQAQLPPVHPNTVYALLMIYHNTLLQELQRQDKGP